MKRLAKIFTIGMAGMMLFTACSQGESGDAFDSGKAISVVSREDGSGTRGAFIELFEIQQKNADGTKKDLTTKEAIIAKQTDIMMATVAGDRYAIGYISTGSLNDTVKAVKIDGAEATGENIKNGSYTVSRPFNIATKGEPSGAVKDFIDYILSADGQAIVSNTYIAVSDAPAYSGDKPSGKIVIAGSSSVSPLMEKLIEAYKEVNPNAEIELQTNDSSAGMQATMDGNSDIGMASRALKDSEKEQLTSIEIALDGIAVVVNNDNPLENLTKEQVQKIFVGEILNWSEVIND